MRINEVQQANRRKAARISGRLSSYTDMNNPAKGGITFISLDCVDRARSA